MPADSPSAYLIDDDGNRVGTPDVPLRTDPTGDTTQPVSAESLPLPSGAATAENQETANTSLDNIDDKTPTLVDGRVPVDGSGVTQPVSAESLPLPSGAATETTLGLIKAKTDNIPTDPAKESGKLTTIDSTLTAIKSTDGIKKIVDALPAGTNNIGDVDLASSIPAGSNEIGKLAQGTKGAAGNAWPTVLYDASGNPVGVVQDGLIYRLQTDTKLVAGAAEIGAVAQGTKAENSGAWPVKLVDGTNGVELAAAPGVQVPSNNRSLVAAGISDDLFVRRIRTDIYGNLQTTPAEASQSAFGETRIAEPYQIANLINKYHIDSNEFGTETAGAGTVTHLPLQSAIKLYVGSASGDKARLRTHSYYRYQAGRGMFVRLTVFNADTGQTNQVRRWGYFDDNDGLFWQISGTTLSMVRRASTSGSPVDYPVNQADWNMDKMNGSGPSGVTIDVTKGNIWEIQFQWLGVGVVNWYINGILVHRMSHPNTIAGPYMRTATLPLSWEVVNSAASTTSWLGVICGSVMIEGGADEPDYTFGLFNSTDKTVGTTEIPLLSIRPKLLFNSIENRMSVVPIAASIATDGKRASYRIVLDGALTGASWTSASLQSGVEYDESATAITGGMTLIRGLLPNSIDSVELDLTRFFNNIARCLRRLAFGSDANILTIMGKNEGSSGGNTLMRASLTWQETR